MRGEEDHKYQDYMRKKLEIEELKRLREVEVERAGKAMKDAEMAEEQSLRDQLDKKEKAIRDEANKKQRGKQALDKEKKLQDEKKALEEQIKQIERKAQVADQEQKIAREKASHYRAEMSTMSQPRTEHPHSQISKMTNKVENSVVTGGRSKMDYTNTRFHNAMIVRHDQESAIQGEFEKLKQGAFDLAKEEATRRNIQKA